MVWGPDKHIVETITPRFRNHSRWMGDCPDEIVTSALIARCKSSLSGLTGLVVIVLWSPNSQVAAPDSVSADPERWSGAVLFTLVFSSLLLIDRDKVSGYETKIWWRLVNCSQIWASKNIVYCLRLPLPVFMTTSPQLCNRFCWHSTIFKIAYH